MEFEIVFDQQSLITQLGSANGTVDSLVRELRTLEAEIGALAIERQQHRLLHQLCDCLGELGSLGGAELFWGSGAAATQGVQQLERVRARVAEFEARIASLEARKRGLLERINAEQYRAGLLEDELFEAQEEEERRKYEWIVEREISALHARPLIMPWTRGGEDDRRFRKSVTSALAICLILALLFPLIHLPALTTPEQELPDEALHITMAQLPRPAPPPRPVPPPPPKLAAQKPVEKPTPQQWRKPQSEAPVEAAQAPVEPKPETGLLAFRQKLAALTDAQLTPELGAQARLNNSANSAANPERSMLTKSAPGSSGGINLASISRSLGPGDGSERSAIHGSSLTQAASGIAAATPVSRPLSGGPGAARTDEEIQIVFDRHKAQLYRLYNAELRRDPTLQGKMILRLTIEPDGSVSLCKLQATDMDAPDLSAQVVDRVRTFNFGAKAVPAVTIVYPIDFLPAA